MEKCVEELHRPFPPQQIMHLEILLLSDAVERGFAHRGGEIVVRLVHSPSAITSCHPFSKAFFGEMG